MSATGVVGKAAPGNLVRVVYTNGNAAARYLQVHNTTSAPGDGAVPVYTLAAEDGSNNRPIILELATCPSFFDTGIYVCHSTTAGTKTLGGADGNFTVSVK
jgi:hypothetical protein